jgi:PST family polysaccharide transporter
MKIDSYSSGFTSHMLTESNISIEDLKSAVFKGGKALFLRHIAGFLINFTGSLILARILGPEIIGLYFISYTVFIICRGIIDFGIKTHFIRLPLIPSSTECSTAFTLQQGLAVLSLLITVLILSPFSAYWYDHKELIYLIASAGIGAYFYSWHSIPIALMERRFEYKKVGIVEVSEILIFNLAAVICTFAGAGILGLILGNILRGFLPALLSVTLTRFRPGLLTNKKAIISLIHTVYPIFGSEFTVWLIVLAPPILVGSIAGVKALGMAQLAYTVLGYTMIIATIFQRISLTTFSRLQNEKELFNNAVHKALQLLAFIYIPLTMGIASLSPWWVPVIYGYKWSGMENVILIAALPVTASALFSIILSALISKGHADIVLKQNILHAVIYWISMAILASPLDALSVPVTHLIAMSAGYLFIYGYNKYCGKLDYKTVTLSFIIGGGIMFISWHSTVKGNMVIPFIGWGAFLVVSLFISAGVKETVITSFNTYKGKL